MAKKKKAKKTEEASPKPKKYEIRAYYKEHGWRETVSHFGLAPKDLSPIIQGIEGPSGPKKPPKKKGGKKGKKKAESADKAQAPKKKGKKKSKKDGNAAKSPEAPYGYKKDGTPRKPPGRKAGKKAGGKKAEKKAAKKAAEEVNAPKKRGRPSTKKHGRPPGRPTADEEVLDWLLAYRAKNQKAGHMLPLDSVIIDLTAKIRK